MSARDPQIVTICALNYVPRAALLIDDLRRFHPEAEITLVLSDRRVPVEGLDRIPARIRWADELGLPAFDSYAFRYGCREFSSGIKARVLRRLMAEAGGPVIFFDPDIRVFARLDAPLRMLDDGAEMVLTPHILHPLGRSLPPRDLDILRAGCFNLGFLALRRAPAVEAFVDWWADQLERNGFADPARGTMCDQRHLDLAPAFVERLGILRDTAYNVAYWNVGQRRLERGADGLRVDGRPLVFFHFSGFDEREPNRFSRYYEGPVATADLDVLARLARGYGEVLRRSPHAALADHPYGFGHFANGAPIPDGLRRLFADRLEPFGGDPFRDLPALLAAEGPYGLTGLMAIAAGWAPVRRAGHRIDAPEARDRYQAAFPVLARRLGLVAA